MTIPDASLFSARETSMQDLSQRWFLPIAAIIVLCALLLRLIALQNAAVLSDHDGIFYIDSIKAYGSWQWQQINALNSDSTPVYPFFAALFTSVGFDPESAGRWVSLVAGVVVVISVMLLASHLHSRLAGLLAAALLAVNPLSVSLSVSVLTEMLYQAFIFLGMYFLFTQFMARRLSMMMAAAIALVFGLSFLTKTEGILFIGLCPLILLAGCVIEPGNQDRVPAAFRPRLSGWWRWSLVFLLLFVTLASLQVMHVGQKMGVPALNGRVAWQALVAYLPDHSTAAAIYGLDLDPATTNITYARSNYEQARIKLEQLNSAATGSNALLERAKFSAKNIDKIYRHFLDQLLSPIGVFFLLFGCLYLIIEQKLRVIGFVFFMAVGVLLAPVIHTSVVPRQMAQAIPLFCILQAMGVIATARYISEHFKHVAIKTELIATCLIMLALFSQAVPIYKTMRVPVANAEYDPAILKEPAALLMQSQGEPVRLAARKSYLSYMAGVQGVQLPFTDLTGLISYLQANDTNYIFVEFDLHEPYPFTKDFLQDNPYKADFSQLWSYSEAGRLVAGLYQLKEER